MKTNAALLAAIALTTLAAFSSRPVSAQDATINTAALSGESGAPGKANPQSPSVRKDGTTGAEGVSALSKPQPPPVWKAVTGQEITAEFVEIKDGKVILRSAQGVIASPPLAALAPESQQLAQKLAKEAEKTALAAEAVRLKTLTPAKKASEIDPRNYLSIQASVLGPVSTKEYDAYFVSQSRGSGTQETWTQFVYLFIKENGAFRSEPIRIAPSVSYNDLGRAANRYTGRNVVQLIELPTLKEGVFRVKQLHDDGVTSEWFVSCKPNLITSGYKVADPAGIKYKSDHSLGISVSKCYFLAAGTDGTLSWYHSPRLPSDGADRAAFLDSVDSWKIDFRPRADSAVKQGSFPYGKSTDRFPSIVFSAAISGGAYGENTVTFSASGNNGELSPWIYPATTPADGYALRFHKEPGNSAPESPAGLLKIEVK